jgi:SAM-dependent methyltransferase
MRLPWWECRHCRGWFAFPVPTPETINERWSDSRWADPGRQTEVAAKARPVWSRLLDLLGERTRPGTLLDFGCGFGEFLNLARDAGWTPSGFDLNAAAVRAASEKGFDVRCGDALEKAGFPEGSFAAVTAIDSLCCSWEPYETLRTFHRLLRPGGVLAMRLTNKRFALGLARMLSRRGPERDARVSGILLGQFHTIGLDSLTEVLRELGFDRIAIESRAITAPWATLPGSTRLAYGAADLVSRLTFSKVDLSPGVLLFAQATARGAAGARTTHAVSSSGQRA